MRYTQDPATHHQNKKIGENPAIPNTQRDKSSKRKVVFMVHSDSVSNPLNQKMVQIPVGSLDHNEDTIGDV